MKKLCAVLVLCLTLPLGASSRAESFLNLPISDYWAPLHFATWTEALAQLSLREGNATLVRTGDSDFPYLIIEKWRCGSCIQYPPPIYAVEVQKGPYMFIGGKFKAATAPDGTTLLVWRK